MDKEEKLKKKMLFYQRKLKEGKIEADPEIKDAIKCIKDIAAIEEININKNISSEDLYTIWNEFYRRNTELQVLDVESGNHKASTVDLIIFCLSLIFALYPDELIRMKIINMLFDLGIVQIIATHPDALEAIDDVLEIIEKALDEIFL
ncbi:MAG: hypothetical protein PHF18_02345 [Methanosarcina sp.]|uniref:hypothetical protein n=1 Tax=Methanosarcina sp. TaxID=2213 RepID=UPI00261A1CB3|nr:hypothetical protein [Methanosarcina sp.]MDD3245700.1 hypothetical protein [Methanosarcina sp.]MDD4247831.1 hypothetical protein [Methanosarcina sp.]